MNSMPLRLLNIIVLLLTLGCQLTKEGYLHEGPYKIVDVDSPIALVQLSSDRRELGVIVEDSKLSIRAFWASGGLDLRVVLDPPNEDIAEWKVERFEVISPLLDELKPMDSVMDARLTRPFYYGGDAGSIPGELQLPIRIRSGIVLGLLTTGKRDVPPSIHTFSILLSYRGEQYPIEIKVRREI